CGCRFVSSMRWVVPPQGFSAIPGLAPLGCVSVAGQPWSTVLRIVLRSVPYNTMVPAAALVLHAIWAELLLTFSTRGPLLICRAAGCCATLTMHKAIHNPAIEVAVLIPVPPSLQQREMSRGGRERPLAALSEL